eukprot:CAMPEP_0113617770 /NCGR_PEP_ID=MMETSP0017_2-20120614/8966_1 /TAXON_ID=2856 /ORGANISM="Cylindrotheca closterium" /LENGTH=1245 /DNA_ID=CAMNT_0000527205 /DNA_START=214 /DNA_END=3951 /DNA_ORIENTATION=- /assembly_acc=CAM_ASM_000147
MDNTIDTEDYTNGGGATAGNHHHHNPMVVEELSGSASEDGQMNENEFERTAIRCFRYFIIVLMLSATIAAGVASFNYLHGEEGRDFQKEFDVVADDIRLLSSDRLADFQADFRSLSWTITGLAKSSNASWPFYTDVNFPVIVSNFRKTTSTSMIALSPIVHNIIEKVQWTNYSQTHQGWIQDHLAYQVKTTTTSAADEDVVFVEDIPNIYPGIFRWTDQGRVRDDGVGPFLPLWQMMDAPQDPSSINLNLLSDESYKQVFDAVLSEKAPIMTEIFDNRNGGLVPQLEPNRVDDLPISLFLYPVYQDVTREKVVAILTSSIDWSPLFALASDEATPPVDVVIQENCDRMLTFQVTGPNVEFKGYEDLHDTAYDQYQISFYLAPDIHLQHIQSEGTHHAHCERGISVYPTRGFWEQYHTSAPASTTGIIVGAFFFMCIIFYLYDAAVHMRQKRILRVASQSEKILSVLYPKTIRDRLFGLEDKVEEEPASAGKGKKGGRKRLNDDLIKATKYQLKQYMKSTPGHLDAVTGGFDSKPIADLFLDATVLFADIAGFTAWSSVREPTQVFTLLESVYRAFDIIARRRKVFKVETVGDCYVAVTGLPEPTKDHARIMALFAQECVERFEELVGMLETTLGPDTGDLGIRVGIHSGPVTAGVLRGDKSRFQLFGDTVNTASRVESTGKRNMIHVSQETADLLTAAGMESELKRREELVSAKGKGKLQTYWLKVNHKEEEQSDYINSKPFDGLQSGSLSNSGFVTKPTNYNNTCLNTDASNYEAIEEMLSPRVRRLCQWNVDILARHLKQIVAHRNAQGPMEENYNEELSRREVAICRQMDVLDEVVEIIPLPGFDPHVYKRQQDPNEIELPEVVMKQIRLYVACIAAMYHDNPFHNFEHASHVMMSVSKLLSRIVAADDILNEDENAAEATDFGWSIHDHTYGITSDPMTQFSVILAAMVHDVDHTGVSNAQLVKENHRLAAMFDNKSIAEQNSIVLAWDILMDSRFHDFRRTIYAAPYELDRFRQLMGNTVMATDIMDKELQALRRNRWDKAFNAVNPIADSSVNQHATMVVPEGTKDKVNRKATIVIEHLIQASDVAHTMQHWHIYQKWNERLFAEMSAAYKAGRLGFNPAEKWYQGEIGFYDHYIIPLAKKLKDCGVFGVASDEYLNYALENRQEWEEKGHAFVAQLTAKYMGDVEPEEEKTEPQPAKPAAIATPPVKTDETGSVTSQVSEDISAMSGSVGSGAELEIV